MDWVRPLVTIVMLPIAAPVAVDAAAAAPMEALVGASNCCSTTSTASSDGRHLNSRFDSWSNMNFSNTSAKITKNSA